MSVIDMIPVEQIAVRVKNISDHDLKGPAMTYANAEYRIPAGGERVMPWLAACHFFGDPRAINIGHPDNDRATQFRRGEVERLQIHWGTYDNPWYSEVQMKTQGGNSPLYQDDHERPTGLVPYIADHDQFMHPGLPRVEIFRVDNDERCYTVIEDPEGGRMGPPDTAKLELATLQDQYNALKDRLDNITNEISFRDPTALDGPEMDPLDNIPAPAEIKVDSASIGNADEDTIVDQLVDPEVPTTAATEDSPRRPVPKKRT